MEFLWRSGCDGLSFPYSQTKNQAPLLRTSLKNSYFAVFNTATKVLIYGSYSHILETYRNWLLCVLLLGFKGLNCYMIYVFTNRICNLYSTTKITHHLFPVTALVPLAKFSPSFLFSRIFQAYISKSSIFWSKKFSD